MAPVVNLLAKDDKIDARVCVTAQHRQMLDQVLHLFQIEPDFDLDVMKPGQGLTDITAAVLSGLTPVLMSFKPHLVLVHGDTTTTLASSLAAYYQQIPVGHVEAGLRTGNIYSPWPEEINRKVTGAIASLHFTPTERSQANLLAEGVANTQIFVTGNTVIDALQEAVEVLAQDNAIQEQIQSSFRLDTALRTVLVTGHRRESFGDGFDQICAALASLAKRDDIQIVYPVHLNPNVRGPVEAQLGNLPRVHLVPPQDYLPFVHLMNQADIILTDSGGVQEEAPSLGKPVLVMRDTTERPEAVDAGTVKIVGTDRNAIVGNVITLLDNKHAYDAMSIAHNPYGDGRAASRIIEAIGEWSRTSPDLERELNKAQ
ncbi:UDP-N-acetylglucosamine 2-epimerase [Rhodobiaceae bacterium]|nr:UDP-N-acetylglucosamine 2-epimerase [Rhodobiaceae bacterium]